MSVDRQEGTWAAVQRVRMRWEADYSRIAKGGANALLGFESLYIHKSVFLR